jgi:hypothetical protein
MTKRISRREFLKASGSIIAGLALFPNRNLDWFSLPNSIHYVDPFPRQPESDQGMLGRIASSHPQDLRAKPNDTSAIIGNRTRDQLIHIYEELIPADAPEFYNRLWYRVWGGYLHSAYIQIVKINLNEPAEKVPESGLLTEVTVPYTTALQLNALDGWVSWRGPRLYYSSTHWITGVVEGPDRTPWYQITSEMAKSEIYYAPARHFRIISPTEYAPINPDTPIQEKRIEVSLAEQTLRAYEFGEEVFKARISSGIPSRNSNGSLPTATPKGKHRIYSKQPSKHMGTVAGGPEIEANDGFSLPGVPWTSFFKTPGGYALHGTYWHNNFGLQMSHGCVNMRNEDAKWIFRWSHPVYPLEIKSVNDWDQPGFGTEVLIY